VKRLSETRGMALHDKSSHFENGNLSFGTLLSVKFISSKADYS
jgi:hypothetical protein